MTIQLSNKVERIKPSPTLSVAATAAQLKAQGQDIVDLSLGEPDFDTPDSIKAAAIQAIQEGFTKYTAVDGIPELKAAIVNKFAKENHLNYTTNQVIASTGAKQCIFNLLFALLNPGDSVLIPTPYWVSYPDIALMADAIPIPLPTQLKQNFKITPEQLEDAITPHTRLLMLNSPSNPSGMAYSQQELSALAEVLLRHPQVFIMTDDIYEHVLWSMEHFVNILNVCPDLYERTIVINGVSKAYAMTGWRIGYAAGPEKIIAAMKKVQSQVTSNPNSIAQVAATAALTGDQSFIKTMTQAFRQRHDFLVAEINQIPGMQCLMADGTFYAFPSVQAILAERNFKSDIEFANYLLSKAQVAVVPGSAFGSPGYIRMSYATSMDVLKDAVFRLKAVL